MVLPQKPWAFSRLAPGVVCERVMELARQLPPASYEEKEFEFEMLKQQACLGGWGGVVFFLGVIAIVVTFLGVFFFFWGGGFKGDSDCCHLFGCFFLVLSRFS